MTLSAELVESTVRHQVYLERLKTGEVNQFAAFLREIDRSLRERLGRYDLTEFTRARLERQLVTIDDMLAEIFNDYYDELAGHLTDIAEYEAGFEARNLDNAVPGFEATEPAPSQVRAAVFAAPMSVRGPDGGSLLESFIRDWTSTETKRVTGAIRQGYFEGQTTAEIIRNVRGTRANNYNDGILAVTSRNAGTVVRTAVQHTASVARFETWNRNEQLIVGYRWVSTLDARTSTLCRSLDGRVFKMGKGPVPPGHPNCRSTTVAELDGRFSFLKQGATRASKDGQVPASETYFSWLKRQPASFQDDAIGPTRATLLRRGGLSADRFARLNLGRNFAPLTLAEMRQKEPVAFERAGL